MHWAQTTRPAPNPTCTEVLSWAQSKCMLLLCQQLQSGCNSLWRCLPESHISMWASISFISSWMQSTCRQDTGTELNQKVQGIRGWIYLSKAEGRGSVYLGRKQEKAQQALTLLNLVQARELTPSSGGVCSTWGWAVPWKKVQRSFAKVMSVYERKSGRVYRLCLLWSSLLSISQYFFLSFWFKGNLSVWTFSWLGVRVPKGLWRRW